MSYMTYHDEKTTKVRYLNIWSHQTPMFPLNNRSPEQANWTEFLHICQDIKQLCQQHFHHSVS